MTRLRTHLALALALAACAPADRDYEIRTVRPGGGPAPRVGATSAERFGGATAAAPAPFAYELPDGWTAGPPAPMRDVDLRAPGDVEVWVTKLPGGAGGPLANLSRWRAQLGLGPVEGAALDALPRVPLLDGAAYRIELAATDGARQLVGLMLFRARGAVFVRMSGPETAVAAQRAAFEQFAASLREASAAEAPAPASGGGLAWTAPAAWFALPPSEFRIAHFRVDAEVEVWVSVLGGDGGGLGANVARWCDQYGRPPPDQAALDALPRIPVLGTNARLVDLTGEGRTRGMLAVVCELGDRAVFVKMDGPSESLRAHAHTFRQFCSSLTVKE